MRASYNLLLFLVASLGLAQLVTNSAQATEIMPAFMGAPAGWSAQGDIQHLSVTPVPGRYEERYDVLKLEPVSAELYGGQTPVEGGTDSQLTAWLWIPEAWRTPTINSGHVDTEMLGVMPIPDPNNPGQLMSPFSQYLPSIGFSNESGEGTLRVWDPNIAASPPFNYPLGCNDAPVQDCWVNSDQWDVPVSVIYNAWTKLTIDYTEGFNTVFLVNDEPVYSYFNGQAFYNYFDPAPIPGFGFTAAQLRARGFTGESSYLAYWSSIPEPSSLALVGLGIVIIGLSKNRERIIEGISKLTGLHRLGKI